MTIFTINSSFAIPKQVDVGIVYDDPKTKIHIGTEIWLNYPVKRFASFPVQFSIENIFLDAKVRFIEC